MRFLGKEQFIIVLIILVVCCVYFIIEYFANTYNEKKIQQINVEAFQGDMINQRGLDILKGKNKDLFQKLININSNELDFFGNDIKMAARFISKNFDIKRIVARKYGGVSGATQSSSQLFGISSAFNTLFDTSETKLKSLISSIGLATAVLDTLKADDNKSQAIYALIHEILIEKKTLYNDLYSYYSSDSDKYLDPSKIKDIISQRVNNPTNKPSLEHIDKMRDGLTISTIENKKSIDNIRDKSQELLEIINADIDVNKDVKQHLLDLFSNQREIFKKINIRLMGFNLTETVVTLIILENVSDRFVQEKQISVRESNKIADDIVNLFTKENKILNNIQVYFVKKSSFMIDDNQFKYFNTMDKNTRVLSNFCRKIKQMNRPKNNSLLFKRLTREFIKKKNEQIDELNGKIDGIMNEMNVKETHNKNLYSIRTSEDAQKQINAINKAKENIANMGKLKINIK